MASSEQRRGLEALSRSRERGEADRAWAIRLTLADWTSLRIAEAFGVREDTLRLWRSAFMAGGIAALRTSIARGPSRSKPSAPGRLPRRFVDISTFGAHIRKVNPRAGPKDLAAVPRLLRRGIPFGKQFGIIPDEPRGLAFISFQTSIRGQLEGTVKLARDGVCGSVSDMSTTSKPYRGFHYPAEIIN